MLKNYFITAIRNVKRHKVFSIINILSLGISMTVGLLIILMLADQKKYDHFHKNKQKIYRIISQRVGGSNPYATSPIPLFDELNNYEGLDHKVQLTTGIGGDAKYDGNSTSMAGYFTDSKFFEIFSFELEKGNPATALNQPYSMVLTQETAKKLFGDQDPLGKTIRFEERGLDVYGFWFDIKKGTDWGDFTITGVLKKPPYKSHLKFDMLTSSSTIYQLENRNLKDFPDNNWQVYHSSYNYVLLPGKKEVDLAKSALNDITERKYTNAEELTLGFDLQPLTEITPGPIMNNNSIITLPSIVYYILSILALIVILLAGFNYTNLSIARALTRAKEVGVRKVAGATRRQLILQFLIESIIISIFALLLAIGLLMLIKPAFMKLWVNNYLNFNLQESILIYLMFLGFAIIIGTMAGIIPGIYLSKFKPVVVLKRFIKLKPSDIPILKRVSLYKILVVSQFSIALFFMVTAILLFRQINHFTKLDYGFNTQNIINIEMQGNDFEQLKHEFQSLGNIESIAFSEYILCSGISQGFNLKLNEDSEEDLWMNSMTISPEYLEIMDLKLIAGRNFPSITNQDNEQYLVINQSALKALNIDNPNEALGKSYRIDNKELTIIGVVEDFYYHLPYTSIEPFAFRSKTNSLKYANIELISPLSMQATIEQLRSSWKIIDPVHPLKYKFFDDQLKSSYQIFNDIGKIIGFIALLAIIISCFGLLGITTFSTENRIREVGIRKVMGAKVVQIIFTLSKSLFVLILIAVVITAPFAYYFNNLWLQQIVNKVEFQPDILLMAVTLTLVLGISSVIFQTLKVAQTNPVNTLKTE